jgi:hypothetical protein
VGHKLITRKIGAAARRAPLDDSDAKNGHIFLILQKMVLFCIYGQKDNLLVFHHAKGDPRPRWYIKLTNRVAFPMII